MARYRLLLAALAFYVLQQANCQEAQISITKKTLELVPTEEDSAVTTSVKCEPPEEYNTRIYSMKIWRDIGNHETLMVTTDPGDTSSVPNAALLGSDVAGQGKFDASGSITGRSITLTIKNTNCKDTAQYRCSISMVNDGGATVSLTKTANLTVTVGAGNITMKKERLESDWVVNETVTFTCNGVVGSVGNGVNITWQWEYQDVDYPRDWKPYLKETYASPEDITFSEFFPVNVCYKQQTSYLKRDLKLVDNNRNYKCYVYRNDKDYKTYAKYLPVGEVTETGKGSDENDVSNDPDDEKPASAVGPIIGGIIGGLVLLIVIIVLVYFLVIRRRRNDKPETYDASENANKPAETPGPPGYSTQPDPSVAYAAPNRFRGDKDKAKRGGQTNKAMEEETDSKPPASTHYDPKPTHYDSKPARYANDFHQGSYDYDNHGRHYSSDDGGSNMNTSMHSIGVGDPTIGTAI